MAVAFPVGIGLALVIGSVLNYIITPKGNPLLLFGGVALVCVAIVLDAMAYRQLSPDAKASTKGIVLSLLGGFGMGLFYPFVAKGTSGENHLGPYTVAFIFGLGILASNIPANYLDHAPPRGRTSGQLCRLLCGSRPPAPVGNRRAESPGPWERFPTLWLPTPRWLGRPPRMRWDKARP